MERFSINVYYEHELSEEDAVWKLATKVEPVYGMDEEYGELFQATYNGGKTIIRPLKINRKNGKISFGREIDMNIIDFLATHELYDKYRVCEMVEISRDEAFAASKEDETILSTTTDGMLVSIPVAEIWKTFNYKGAKFYKRKCETGELFEVW